MILSHPKFGTRKNPPKNVPVMLPSVDTARIEPDVFPADFRFCNFTLVMIGGIMPNAIEDGRNSRMVPVIAPILMLLITDTKRPNMTSDSTGIYKIRTAAHNVILQMSSFSFPLSANRPPTAFPILPLKRMIPITLVQITLESPK